MEATAAATVIEAAHVSRGKRWVKIPSDYLRISLPENNTHLLKCFTLLGKKKAHNQCPAMHSTVNFLMELSGRKADEACSSPQLPGVKVPRALLHCRRAEELPAALPYFVLLLLHIQQPV